LDSIYKKKQNKQSISTENATRISNLIKRNTTNNQYVLSEGSSRTGKSIVPLSFGFSEPAKPTDLQKKIPEPLMISNKFPQVHPIFF